MNGSVFPMIPGLGKQKKTDCQVLFHNLLLGRYYRYPNVCAQALKQYIFS